MSDHLVSTSELADFLKVSLSTVSRQLKQLILDGYVVRFGLGKNIKYACLRNVPGIEQPVVVREVNAQAEICDVGKLWVTHTGTLMETADDVIVYDDLPWYFSNLKPQGFIGKSIARQISDRINTAALTSKVNIQPKLENWSSDDLLRYLVNFRFDTSGNFELFKGYQSRLQRYRPVSLETVLKSHDKHADGLIKSANRDSSAGGEQPKFNCRLNCNSNNIVKSCLVKFSPLLGVGNPVAERVKDLLVCEHIALSVLAEFNGHAAFTELQRSEKRQYLEVTRFDRVSVGEAEGQLGMISLEAVIAEYVGDASDWVEASIALKAEGILTAADASLLQTWLAYSRFIGNSDAHNGNVSLFLKDFHVNGLTPAYDILPMRYMPVSGDIPNPEINIKKPKNIDAESWELGRELGLKFWNRAAVDKSISTEFIEIAKQWLVYIKSNQ